MHRRLVRLGIIIGGCALAVTAGVARSAKRPANTDTIPEASVHTTADAVAPGSQTENAAASVAPPVEPAIPEGFGLQVAADGLGPPKWKFSVNLGAPPPTLVGKAILVDQGLQMMGIYVDGVEIRRMPVSTGRPTLTTYTLPWNGYVGEYVGTFQSFTGGKADNAWYLYHATGAILIHSAPYYEEDGVKEFYDLDALGNHPASAGCIRLHPDDAQWLTDWRPLNTAITITELPGPIEGLSASG